MAIETIEVSGHIIDSLLLAKILDTILDAGCDYEIVEFDGPHLLPAAREWEEIADYALDWAVKHSAPTAA